MKEMLDHPPSDRVDYAKKNKINNLTAELAKQLRSKYLKDTPHISAFLSAPENYDCLRQYEAVVDEFQLAIIAKRKEYQTFDSVIVYLYRLLIGRDPVLAKYKRLTMTMLFYMYWHCDIGITEDAEAN
jgi:hypothetical protein